MHHPCIVPHNAPHNVDELVASAREVNYWKGYTAPIYRGGSRKFRKRGPSPPVTTVNVVTTK